MSVEMVMLRPAGKATKIAQNIMKQKRIKIREQKSESKPLQTPYLQH